MPSTRALRPHLAPGLFLSLTVIALALTSGIAAAQSPTPPPGSVALRWNDCFGDHGAAARTFACDTNSGSDLLVISAFPPVDMYQLDGAETALTIWSTASSTPGWWALSSGGCRGTAGLSAAFSPPATSTTCVDPWLGQAAGGVAFDSNYYGPNVSRLRTICAIPGATTVYASDEVYVATILLRHTKTVGTGSCSGCPTAACIGLEFVKLYQPVGVGDFQMLQPLPGSTSDVVGWQMDASMPENIVTIPHETYYEWGKTFSSCSAAVTSARHPTWGAVKSLYR